MASSHSFFSSSIGRKVVMAITGLLLIGFVIAHLLGNLQVFLGAETFNAYATFLKSMPGVLWAARIGLLLVFVLHIYTGFKLRGMSNAARPVDYRDMKTVQAPVASLYMLHTGIVVLIFVLVHLAHFTLGLLQPELYAQTDAMGRHDVFSMLVGGFMNPAYSLFYIFCMLMLGVHLSHGISSMFQTLGLSKPGAKSKLQLVARALATFIALGYIAIPVGVLVGLISLPVGG